MMSGFVRQILGTLVTVLAIPLALAASSKTDQPQPPNRKDVLARAQIWAPTDIPSIDLKNGPVEGDGFASLQELRCEYLDKKLSGHSPKFECDVADGDTVKVKFGGANGEVYAEVATTRLLWALGFGADRMYPVRVVCHGCPEKFNGIPRPGNDRLFDPAAVERKFGDEYQGDSTWSWDELDRLVDESAGGAPKAHRDALKLLAVFLQHTDNKPEQQRVVCVDRAAEAPQNSCEHPVMVISDVGLTFGRANFYNRQPVASANLVEWSKTPVWKGDKGCVGNLPKSFTGTLNYPIISDAGREFLAGLLTQLTDRQLRDMFDVARFTLRARIPESGRSGFATTDEWVQAFKVKRAQIVERRCS